MLNDKVQNNERLGIISLTTIILVPQYNHQNYAQNNIPICKIYVLQTVVDLQYIILHSSNTKVILNKITNLKKTLQFSRAYCIKKEHTVRK